MAAAPQPHNRIAWVTGAGTGIGRALAKRLAEDGWIVAISARTARDLDALAAEVPGRITSFQLDVTDARACAATVAAIEDALGPIELAILNAGASYPVNAENFSVGNFRKTVDVNLMGEINCMGPLAPLMIGRHSGQIALMASLSGYLGLPGAAPYSATKAALINAAQAFRPDFERFGVTISVINPGFVRTPLTSRNTAPMPFLMDVDDAVERIVRGLDSKRFEIAFPWQMSAMARVSGWLPHWAKFAAARRMLRRKPD
jgi:NAD(P)-dependent dehydrogenase (short-subunit alcohol dehydrogenase family)